MEPGAPPGLAKSGSVDFEWDWFCYKFCGSKFVFHTGRNIRVCTHVDDFLCSGSKKDL